MAFNTTRAGKYVDQALSISNILSSEGPKTEIPEEQDLYSLSSHGYTSPFGEPASATVPLR